MFPADMLAAGQPPAMMAAPSGPEPAGPQPAGPDLESPEGILRAMLELAVAYRGVERDDQDLLGMERVTTLIQQLLAQQQSDRDSLMGGQARMLRRLAR